MPDTRDDSAAMPPSVWQPTCGLPALLQRSEFIWRLRHFFHDHQVAEVQTPILCQELIVDRHIDPVVLPGSSLGLSSHRQRDFYLQSSPEYGMKRLLAAGRRNRFLEHAGAAVRVLLACAGGRVASDGCQRRQRPTAVRQLPERFHPGGSGRWSDHLFAMGVR